MSGDRPVQAEQARFGFRLAGVPVLVPAAATALFLPAAGVEPMPLAPPRLRGFTQRQGRAVPVFDAAAAAPATLPVRMRRPLLVFDAMPEPAALLVDQAPERLTLAAAPVQSPLPPDVPWADACVDARVDDRGQCWWGLDLPRLFDTLARA